MAGRVGGGRVSERKAQKGKYEKLFVCLFVGGVRKRSEWRGRGGASFEGSLSYTVLLIGCRAIIVVVVCGIINRGCMPCVT